jgi:hypothetical protein
MKNCSKCSTQFECGADVGKCWCMDLKVKPEVLSKLKEEFSNCLCPECLKDYAYVE